MISSINNFITIVFCVLAVLALKFDGVFGTPVSERPQDKNLLLAFVVNRHGDRTPAPEEVDLSSCKEKLEKAIEMEGYEALTNTGKRRAFQIGKYLRQRYGSSQGFDLLSKYFYPKQIAVRSTFKYRAQMTAQIAMSALYPPEPAQQWDSGVGAYWQPVPYTMVPQKEDYLRYYSSGVCSRFDELMAQAQVDGLKEEFAQFNDLIPIIKQHTGVNFTDDLLNYQSLLDLFKSQTAYGFDVPDWARPILPRLNEAGRLAYRLYNRNDEMKKIGGGVLLNNFMELADKIISGTVPKDTPRVHIFSSHDFNVGAFMDVSLVDDNITQSIPDYASVYSLELYKSTDGDYFVLPVYLPQAGTSMSTRLRIQDCDGHYCEFNKFKSMTAKYLLPESEFYSLCNIATSQ